MGPAGPARYAILVAGEPDETICASKGTFEQMFLDLLAEQPLSVTASSGSARAAASVGDNSSDHPAAAAVGTAGAAPPAEEWRVYFAFKGELPTTEELASFKGIVITGSVADAFGSDPWLLNLRATVKAAIERRTRVLGVCFGHQLVGCTLGARVGRAGCWEVGARQVAVAPEARERLAAEGAGWARLLPDALCLHEFHQDQVLEVPPGATLLASSQRCPVEMYTVGDHVLCIQGHPEFDREVVEQLAAPRLAAIGKADVQRMQQLLEEVPVAQQAQQLARSMLFIDSPLASLPLLQSLEEVPVAQQAQQLQRICRAFLKG
ncbi:hypothetical protein COHA_006553 [Chlorella ohadii]|uniref:Glutamine amidotransferase domain-containing protein n=1 Tax=Chlorella ohadii TaxID=2649997 RepID=A0AAD5H0Q8_9CHLO|nr:hypothetical protein COHA_006553 [Chlorella ohadii]